MNSTHRQCAGLATGPLLSVLFIGLLIVTLLCAGCRSNATDEPAQSARTGENAEDMPNAGQTDSPRSDVVVTTASESGAANNSRQRDGDVPQVALPKARLGNPRFALPNIFGLYLSSSGERMAVFARGREVVVYDTATGDEVERHDRLGLEPHHIGLGDDGALVFSTDGSPVPGGTACASADGAGVPCPPRPKRSRSIYFDAWRTTPATITAGDVTATLYLGAVQLLPRISRDDPGPARWMSFSPDGSHLVVLDHFDVLRVWAVDTRQVVGWATLPPRPVQYAPILHLVTTKDGVDLRLYGQVASDAETDTLELHVLPILRNGAISPELDKPELDKPELDIPEPKTQKPWAPLDMRSLPAEVVTLPCGHDCYFKVAVDGGFAVYNANDRLQTMPYDAQEWATTRHLGPLIWWGAEPVGVSQDLQRVMFVQPGRLTLVDGDTVRTRDGFEAIAGTGQLSKTGDLWYVIEGSQVSLLNTNLQRTHTVSFGEYEQLYMVATDDGARLAIALPDQTIAVVDASAFPAVSAPDDTPAAEVIPFGTTQPVCPIGLVRHGWRLTCRNVGETCKVSYRVEEGCVGVCTAYDLPSDSDRTLFEFRSFEPVAALCEWPVPP